MLPCRRLIAGTTLSLIASAGIAIAPSPALASSCAYAHNSVTSTSRAHIRSAVICLINKQRTSRGLPRLRTSRRLNRSAQKWTYTMVSRGIFTHGSNFSARISAVGFNWSTAGENIAVGFKTPWSVVAGWMASTGHCQNILNPDFSRVGTGVLSQGISGWGPGATWTQDFALHMGASPPSHNTRPMNGCPYRI